MTVRPIKLRPSRMACRGAPTKSVREFGTHMEECRACGSACQWQLVNHPIWGFAASCEHRRKAAVNDEAAA